jgi:hypothetical protein
MRSAILVLGMHRSGTSAITGTMVHLGAAPPLGLMPADEGNERGYFESVPIMQLHDALLRSAGTCWHDWCPFDPQWLNSPAAVAFKTDAKKLLKEEFDDAPLFALKDPRICRFLPFWLSVLDEAEIKPYAVLPLRSPFEVARSLRTRNGFSIEKGLLLWLRHSLDAERMTRSLPRAILTVDEFLADWRGSALRIARDFGIVWPRFDDESAARIDRFLSRDLKHHNLPEAHEVAIQEWVVRSYEALLILGQSPHSILAHDTLNQVSDSFRQACLLTGPVFAEMEANVAALKAERDSLIDARERSVELERAHGDPPRATAALSQLSGHATNCSAMSRLDQLRTLHTETETVRRTLQELQGTLAARRRRKETAPVARRGTRR